MIRLTTSYHDFLRSAKSQVLTTHEIVSVGDNNIVSVSATPTATRIIIPPMNANLDFSTVPRISTAQRKQRAGAAPVILPSYFNWADTSLQLTPPPNQGRCGSCWAVAIASCISDNYATRGLVPKNPNLSPTFLLACYPDSMKCGGGNPWLCLEWISKNGIAAVADSYDYNWCFSNPDCSGASKTAPDTEALNRTIPDCVVAPLRFFVSSIAMPEDPANDPTKLDAATTDIKTFLYSKGPAVVGFSVFQNFTGGNYTCNGNNPDNIYLENVDYKTGVWSDTPLVPLGGHAVVLVGWGQGRVKESLLKKGGNPGTWVDVPYWIARNSWTASWGMGGYFRIARYPFNKKSQFDTTVVVREVVGQNEENIPTGGVLFFETNYFGYDTPPETFEYYSSSSSGGDTSNVVFYFVITMLLLMVVLTLVILVSTATAKKQKKGGDTIK